MFTLDKIAQSMELNFRFVLRYYSEYSFSFSRAETNSEGSVNTHFCEVGFLKNKPTSVVVSDFYSNEIEFIILYDFGNGTKSTDEVDMGEKYGNICIGSRL